MASTRISIKIIISSDQLSTVVFFLVSTAYVLMSYLFNSNTFQSPFVTYHMQICSRIVLRPDEERVMVRIYLTLAQQLRKFIFIAV